MAGKLLTASTAGGGLAAGMMCKCEAFVVRLSVDDIGEFVGDGCTLTPDVIGLTLVIGSTMGPDDCCCMRCINACPISEALDAGLIHPCCNNCCIGFMGGSNIRVGMLACTFGIGVTSCVLPLISR